MGWGTEKLKFNIRDIDGGGLPVSRLLDDQEVRALLASCGAEPRDVPASLQLDLVLEPMDRGVQVRGRMAGEFTVTCARCLGPCRIRLEEPDLLVAYLPAAAEEATEEEELALQDLDTYTFDGKEVDLQPLIRDQLVLAIPMAPVCSAACRGLCSRCGARLDQGGCTCAEAQTAPAPPAPWAAALKRVKIGEGGGGA